VLGFSPSERLRQRLDEMVTPESMARIGGAFAEELARASALDADPDEALVIEVEYRQYADRGVMRRFLLVTSETS